MGKGLKALFTVMVLIIGLLAITNGFLFGKVRVLQSDTAEKSLNQTKDTTKSIESIPESTETKTPTKAETETPATASSSVTEPAPLNNRPSAPSDTIKVESGQTLSTVAAKVDLTWTELAAANGLEDPNKVKVGQSLIVPKNNQVNFTISQDKAKDLQTQVDGGKLVFRLSAIDTVKSDISPVYGLGPTDTYKEVKIDSTSGLAVISVTKGDKKFEIKLSQPVKKGEKGIWAIESVKPVTI